jgi:predicted glycoside hydrolase/deacetylase ChbG (UPF0249 family)
MPPRLIINADDFGLTPGINRAVVELHRAGAITSATLMANGPAFDDAVARARANPALGVGCHLVFTGGMPISHPEAIPTLLGADGKTFRPSLIDFAQAALRGAIDPNDIAVEAQAQIQKLQRAGIDVTHIDTHKHTHLLPVIARTVFHIANRCGVPSIRNPIEPHWSATLANAPLRRRLEMHLLNRFERAFLDLTPEARAYNLVPEGTLGIAATGTLDTAVLDRTIDCLVHNRSGGTFELLCHPGHQDAALDAQTTRLRASRETEYHALLAVVPKYSRNPATLELIHYGNLGVPGLQRASGQYLPNTGYEKVL